MLPWQAGPIVWSQLFQFLLTIYYIVSNKPSTMGRNRARMPQDQRCRSGRRRVSRQIQGPPKRLLRGNSTYIQVSLRSFAEEGMAA
jgi:hypothetical protein